MDTDDVFIFFLPFFSICVHDYKMAVTGNFMHLKTEGENRKCHQ